jgi:hypothetical protein
VRDALTLTGWTTFSRGRQLAGLVGVRTNRILADAPLPGVTRQQHEAARHAVGLARTRVPSGPPARQT